MRSFVRIGIFLSCVCLLSTSSAYAQAAIAGVVKDASGGVLPGVTVEASSPALIEKTRSVVTDGSGQYKIVDLRPGAYSLSFTLAGFNVVKREGIELSGDGTVSINADLKVGAVEESITVTGETPIVDVQSSRQTRTIDADTITAIPTARQFYSIGLLIPAVTLAGTTRGQDVGGINGPDIQPGIVIHGSHSGDGRLQQDGLSIGNAGSQVTAYVTNAAAAQEVVFNTSGGMGEAQSGGPSTNIVPKDGGNKTTGTIFVNGSNSSLASSNYTQALKDRNLTAPNTLRKLFDINPTFGGPFRKDSVWFFASGRYVGAYNTVAGMFLNKNAGNLASWTYSPDTSQQAFTMNDYKIANLRLTWQATPRNKLTAYWDEQARCNNCGSAGGTATTSPEASSKGTAPINRVQQVTWTSPVSSRLLLEAGWGTYLSRYGGVVRDDGSFNPLMIPVTEQAGTIPGLVYRSPASYGQMWTASKSMRASASYVTGSHSLKFGLQFDTNPHESPAFGPTIAYRLNNGVPNQLTLNGVPRVTANVLRNTGLYVQDQSTFRRLTVQGGVRFDAVTNNFPAQAIGPTQYLPSLTFAPSSGLSYKDMTARAGVSYDVLGNGKTALKASIGKYMNLFGSGGLGALENPATNIATSTTRAWTDRNSNFAPDCNLLSPAANGECGAFGTPNFGTATPTGRIDPAVLSGWGVRPYQWEVAVQLQQQIMPRVGVNIGYFRRWFGNFTTTDNLSLAASDFGTFNVPVPAPPAGTSLPAGTPAIVTGYVNPNSTAINNLLTKASSYGNQFEHFNGIDLSANARLPHALTIQGGYSTGRTMTENCDIVAQLPELLGTQPASFCHNETPWLWTLRGLATYTVPRIDVQVSTTFQSNQVTSGSTGVSLAANYNVPSAVAQANGLGRPLTAGAANQTVNLLAPNSLYGDRINELDFRVAKILRRGRTRSQFSLDLYNAPNSSAVQTYNQTYGSAWLTPTQILPARYAKLTAQIDF